MKRTPSYRPVAKICAGGVLTLYTDCLFSRGGSEKHFVIEKSTFWGHFGHKFRKTAWKWRNLFSRGGSGEPREPPLPTGLTVTAVTVTAQSLLCGVSINSFSLWLSGSKSLTGLVSFWPAFASNVLFKVYISIVSYTAGWYSSCTRYILEENTIYLKYATFAHCMWYQYWV